MQFGVRNADAPKSSGAGTGNISWFGRNDTRVRFLEEIADWTKYQQHFSASARSTYPCTGDQSTCPGCLSDNEQEARTSTRYLVNAVAVDRGYVNLYPVPYSCMAPLERASDKDDGTIRARDFTIVQTKDDNNITKYIVEREERSRFDFDEFESKMHDHQAALAAQFEKVWGSNDSPVVQEARTNGQVKIDFPEQKSDKPEKVEITKDEDLPPTEPQVEKDGDAEETITLTEEQIRAMTKGQLEVLYEQVQIDPPDNAETAEDLAEYLLEQLV
jgi:hypothetical protein